MFSRRFGIQEKSVTAEIPLTEIRGIGKKTFAYYQHLGVQTVRELLRYYPRAYESYPAVSDPDRVMPEETAAIRLRAARAPSLNPGGRRQVAILEISTERGPLRLIWYHMPYIRSLVKRGGEYVFYGRVSEKNGVRCMEQPGIFYPEEYDALAGRLLPVYPVTKGLTSKQIRKNLQTVFAQFPAEEEFLPPDLLKRQGLCGLDAALRQIHFPDGEPLLSAARERLAFEEFFLFILMMKTTKKEAAAIPNAFSFRNPALVDDLIGKLPFPLTGAQERTVYEVIAGMNGPGLMQRLIQGDVGSGKTAVAFLAMAYASLSGYQAAIMAPTDVLARQHAAKLSAFCEQMGLDVPVVLLTGSLRAFERREALSVIEREPRALIAGTHALIQEGVSFSNLALVVTDEQHRFGVRQREAFAGKGLHPHVLVMSATPIPRTLAIILYGDLDISVIDELPARRLPVKNCVVGTRWRETAYRFMEKEITAGHQIYVVCPLVEESEGMEGENVLDYAQHLKTYFNGRFAVGILHGRMKPEEKNKVMEQFLANQISILVSTTVIEVGVDVPNATVMLIENAERFGLAQLHQLRGRIGRGDAQGYCIFMQGKDAKEKNPRLEILNASNDGFYIAQEDLKLRGPGEFFGVRQSGEFAFSIGDIYADGRLLKAAADEAEALLREDPELSEAGHHALREVIEQRQKSVLAGINL